VLGELALTALFKVADGEFPMIIRARLDVIAINEKERYQSASASLGISAGH